MVDETVFNDEQIVLNWTPVVDRTYRYYFIYRDGEKVGETTVNQINLSTYTDGPLAYNMEGTMSPPCTTKARAPRRTKSP